MKKIMAVVTAVLFVSALMVVNMAFADEAMNKAAEGAVDKAAAPMSDTAKDGAEVSKKAKEKSKEAKMEKKKKKGKKSKKSKKSKRKS